MILTYLLPLNILKGQLPHPTLFGRYPRLAKTYGPIVIAIRQANLSAFDEALVASERQLIKLGTYAVVERCREICLRSSFKLVFASLPQDHVPNASLTHCRRWNALGQSARVPMASFEAGLRLRGVKLDAEEVECLLSVMIAKVLMSIVQSVCKLTQHQGYMKGYLSHEKQTAVLSDPSKGKPTPFPALSDVRPLIVFPY